MKRSAMIGAVLLALCAQLGHAGIVRAVGKASPKVAKKAVKTAVKVIW